MSGRSPVASLGTGAGALFIGNCAAAGRRNNAGAPHQRIFQPFRLPPRLPFRRALAVTQLASAASVRASLGPPTVGKTRSRFTVDSDRTVPKPTTSRLKPAQ